MQADCSHSSGAMCLRRLSNPSCRPGAVHRAADADRTDRPGVDKTVGAAGRDRAGVTTHCPKCQNREEPGEGNPKM